MIFIIDRFENIVRKGENAGFQHFLLFPQCFQKALYFRVVKSQNCVVYVKLHINPEKEDSRKHCGKRRKCFQAYQRTEVQVYQQ